MNELGMSNQANLHVPFHRLQGMLSGHSCPFPTYIGSCSIPSFYHWLPPRPDRTNAFFLPEGSLCMLDQTRPERASALPPPRPFLLSTLGLHCELHLSSLVGQRPRESHAAGCSSQDLRHTGCRTDTLRMLL